MSSNGKHFSSIFSDLKVSSLICSNMMHSTIISSNQHYSFSTYPSICSRQDVPDSILSNPMFFSSLCSDLKFAASSNTISGCSATIDSSTFATMLQQYGNAKSLSCGRVLHVHIIMDTCHGCSTYLMSILMQMYGNCCALKDARKVFLDIGGKNVYSWNIMIGINVKHGHYIEAIQLFQQMQIEGVFPDKYSVVGCVSAHASLRNLLQGKILHSSFASTSMEEDIVVGTALVSLYAYSGSIECAQLAVQKLTERDIVLYNAMIAAYSQEGKDCEAHQLFNNMYQEAFLPNKVTFLNVLDSCVGYGGLMVGKRLHVQIGNAGLESDIFLQTTLISMYGKCGDPARSDFLFDKLNERNVVSWNAVIAVHAHQAHGGVALLRFNQIQQEALIPDKITFRTILCSISSRSILANMKFLHAYVVSSGLDSDMVVSTSLFSMFGRCGDVEYSRKLFDGMLKRDLIAWNAMIAVYAQNGYDSDAIQVLREMQQAGVPPDKVTLMSSLSVCAGVSLDSAQGLFDQIHQRNVTVWNAMLGACEKHGHNTHALGLFQQMMREGITPDKVTFLTMLSVCANRIAITDGKLIHTFIIYSQYELHDPLACGLVHMYNKFGDLEGAHSVFQLMHERDTIFFNVMITALIEHGLDTKALVLWPQMHRESQILDEVTFVGLLEACAVEGTYCKGKYIHTCIMNSEYESDVMVVTPLFNMYHSCRSLEEAQSVFASIVQHDVISWTAVIATYAERNQGIMVLQLFQQMQIEGVSLDNAVYVNILAACADAADLMQGKIIHARIVNSDPKIDVSLGNALVNMYGKCGSMMDAHREFRKLPSCDVLSFNIMINGCAQHGHGIEALQLYHQMLKISTSPNEYTFGSILTACSHVGFVEEGYQCLRSILEETFVVVALEHFDCMVDILGRTGRLDEAEGLLIKMPMQPTHLSWMTLLGASRIQEDINKGKQVSKHIFELDCGDASPYVALSNLYAIVGKMNDSESVVNS